MRWSGWEQNLSGCQNVAPRIRPARALHEVSMLSDGSKCHHLIYLDQRCSTLIELAAPVHVLVFVLFVGCGTRVSPSAAAICSASASVRTSVAFATCLWRHEFCSAVGSRVPDSLNRPPSHRRHHHSRATCWKPWHGGRWRCHPSRWVRRQAPHLRRPQ